ncbi:HNH endonuclease signature motif containing protein [Leucobacter musarum]|uniref:HNH endonuclease signature motif containing protein n=1 Tax=Leucobacter musarum TaxID=1930747 RepID=UPI0006A7A4CA|nr:HNH endonuclease signature motif containing protein [Leucobacter musarum]
MASVTIAPLASLSLSAMPDAAAGAPGASGAGAGSGAVTQIMWWIERLEQQQRALDAARLELLNAALEAATGLGAGNDASRCDAGSRNRELEYRALRADLAGVLGASERTAESQLDTAWRVRHDYLAVHEALAIGEITVGHARVIADAGVRVGSGSAPDVVARRSAYEAEVLTHARVESVNRLRPIARRIAEQHAVESLDERHREAARERRVMVHEREDGMSDLTAYLPTVEAFAIHDRLTRIAREAQRVEAARVDGEAQDSVHEVGEAPDAPVRRRDEVRADVFVSLLLNSDLMEVDCSKSTAGSMRARVQVIVPVEGLAGVAAEVGAGLGTSFATNGREGRGAERDHDVAELIGAGPVPVGSAREIAAETPVWERVTVESTTGSVLSVNRYRPSEEMRRRLGARDQHCRFPGCRVPLSRCDLDHTVDAALGGATATDNLAHLCRGHHTLKHHTGWLVEQRDGGDLLWTSPTGRKIPDRPPSRVRFARVRSGDDDDGDDNPQITAGGARRALQGERPWTGLPSKNSGGVTGQDSQHPF